MKCFKPTDFGSEESHNGPIDSEDYPIKQLEGHVFLPASSLPALLHFLPTLLLPKPARSTHSSISPSQSNTPICLYSSASSFD